MSRLGFFPRMKVIACVVVCLVAMSGGVRAQEQTGGAVPEKAVLRGTVVNSVTHQPIGRALVKSTDGRFATMTNDRGQFEMVFKEKKVDPANGDTPKTRSSIFTSFSDGVGGTTGSPSVVGGQAAQTAGQQSTVDRPDFLTAVRTGYLNPQTPWGNAIQIGHDQEEVTISLTPEAKVIGHVTLADGEGAADMPLELYRQTVEDGRMRWIEVGSTQARSDGEFRFANLEAGNYKLYSAELPDRDPVTSDPRGQGYGYPPDYYPSATDFAGAGVIHLAGGETFQAALRPEKRRYYRVHIGVNGGSGGQLETEVERDGHPGPGFTLGYDFRDGSIGGMLPDGNYLVKVSSQGNGSGLTGVVNLSMHGGPGVAMVTLLPGTNIDVRVNQEFGSSESSQNSVVTVYAGPANARRQVPVMLQLFSADEFRMGPQYMAQPPSDPDAEGLVVPGVPAGEYRVSVQAPGGYVASVRCGGTDLHTSNLVVAGGATLPPIEVTIRNDGAEIDGSIVDMAGRGTANGNSVNNTNSSGYVYLLPTQAGAEMKLIVPGPNGEFQIAQVAPGTYRVLAFDRPRGDLEYWNEDAMRKYDAQVVTLAPGQKEKIRVSLSSE